jgi:hypothetical protein
LSAVVPRIEHSLYSLGYASESVLAVARDYWFVLGPDDAFPFWRAQLVEGVQQAARNLSEQFNDEFLEDIACDVDRQVAAGWSHLQATWSGEQHAEVANVLARALEPETIPADWWENGNHVNGPVWVRFRELVAELIAECAPQQGLYLRLGRSVGRVISAAPADSERRNLESVARCLSDPQSEASFADLHARFLAAFSSLPNVRYAGFVEEQIGDFHHEILGLLAQPAPAAVHSPASRLPRPENTVQSEPRSGPTSSLREPSENAFILQCVLEASPCHRRAPNSVKSRRGDDPAVGKTGPSRRGFPLARSSRRLARPWQRST